ncbi:MAG: hypothetical protein ABSF68_12390 [Candidatus Acidiferrales bacterium]
MDVNVTRAGPRGTVLKSAAYGILGADVNERYDQLMNLQRPAAHRTSDR